MTTNERPFPWAAMEERAREMSACQLFYARTDARKAAEMARDIEQQGFRVLKSEGYYMDEISVYVREMRRRGLLDMEVVSK